MYSLSSIKWSMCFSKPPVPWARETAGRSNIIGRKKREQNIKYTKRLYDVGSGRSEGQIKIGEGGSIKSKNTTSTYLGAPLQPKLVHVVMAAALYHLVARVVLDVVQFVLHEQIFGTHLVAADQQSL